MRGDSRSKTRCKDTKNIWDVQILEDKKCKKENPRRGGASRIDSGQLNCPERNEQLLFYFDIVVYIC